MEKVLTRPTPPRTTVAPKDKRLTPVHLKVPPAPPQPKKVLVLVDLPVVRVKRKGALIPSAHVITGQARENSAATTAKNQGGPAAAHQDGGNDGAAVAGIIVARPRIVALTPAALSAPQQAAVPTATVVEATRTATATTAQKVADEGTPNVHQTQSMSAGVAEDVDDPGGISTRLPLQKTPAALVRAATAAGRGTDGTIGAAPEAPPAGAAAQVQDPGGGATVVATAPPAAPLVQTRALLTGEAPGVERTVTRIAETSTVHASIAPSLHALLHLEALTATPIHPARWV